MARVKISKKVNDLADLTEKINAKNTADGEQSFLNKVINFESLNTKVDRMLDFEKRADDANRLKEEMNEQKKKMAVEIYKDIQQIRNLLKAHYPNDLKKLGAWGFVIDEVNRKKVEEPA